MHVGTVINIYGRRPDDSSISAPGNGEYIRNKELPKDVEFGGTKYEVMLNDGAKIEFDKKGNWDNVDCETYAVPTALVPASITRYVKANFPGSFSTCRNRSVREDKLPRSKDSED